MSHRWNLLSSQAISIEEDGGVLIVMQERVDKGGKIIYIHIYIFSSFLNFFTRAILEIYVVINSKAGDEMMR